MRILIADKFEKIGLDGLESLGCQVKCNPSLEGESLAQALQEEQADVLVVRSTKVNEAAIEGSRLKLIIRAGAGYDNIDVNAASNRGVYVSNCPGKNSHAVVELAFGLMLAIDRQIPDNVEQLRHGRWNKKAFSNSRGIYGRTLGLVGMGRIGQEMVPRAKAFGMNVVAYSRWMTPEVAAALGIGRAPTLRELAVRSDIVSIHVSLSPDTKGIIDEEFLASMNPGAYLINTSRSAVIQQAALEKALRERRIFAGLDVFEGEPTGGEGSYDGVMRELPNCYCTHHIGASTQQAQESIAKEVVRIVREYRSTGHVPNVINVGRGHSARYLLEVRHQDRVGVLAGVLAVLKEEDINVQEMENIMLSGQAAIAQIALDRQPSAEAIEKLKLDRRVFDASVTSIQALV